MIAKVKELELKRAMLNQELSLNIISLPVLDAVGVRRDDMTGHPMEVSGFGGNCIYTLGFVNLDLVVRLVRAVHRFHVIDSRLSTMCYMDVLAEGFFGTYIMI